MTEQEWALFMLDCAIELIEDVKAHGVDAMSAYEARDFEDKLTLLKQFIERMRAKQESEKQGNIEKKGK